MEIELLGVTNANSQTKTNIVQAKTSFENIANTTYSLNKNLKTNNDNSISLNLQTEENSGNLMELSSLNKTGLVGYWSMDGAKDTLIGDGATITDESTFGNDLLTTDNDLIQTLFYRSAKSNQGIEFGGDEDNDDLANALTSPNTASLDIGGVGEDQLTLMAWVKIPAGWTDPDAGIIAKGSGVSEQYTITTNGANDFTFRITNTSGYIEVRPAGSYVDDTWTHVTGTYDGVNMVFYLNGARVKSKATTGDIVQSNGNFHIGRRIDGDTRFLKGMIDEVSVWKRALNDSEIKEIYRVQSPNHGELLSNILDSKLPINWNTLAWETNSPTAKALPSSSFAETDYDINNIDMNGIIRLFHLDESSSSTNFQDESGNSQDSNCSNCPITGELGRFNQAVKFNGTDQYIELPHHSDFDIAQGAISVWFKPENLLSNSRYGLVSKDHNGFGNGGHIGLTVYSNYSLRFRMQSSTTSFEIFSPDVSIKPGFWNHALAVFGPNGMKLYLNGEPMASGAYTGGLNSASSGGAGGNTEPLIIGASSYPSNTGSATPTDYEFNGYIDEVAIFNREFSASEASALFERGCVKLKVQVRNCSKEDCSDNPFFIGPDGTSSTYYTEEMNPTLGHPTIDISNVAGNSQYFQYKSIIETLNPSINIKVKSMSINGSE